MGGNTLTRELLLSWELFEGPLLGSWRALRAERQPKIVCWLLLLKACRLR